MSVRSILLTLILSASAVSVPAMAGETPDHPPPGPSGPVIVEDFCPG